MGALGVTGTGAANALARGGGCDPGRRHATAGLHHRLLGAVHRTRPTHHRAQRPALRRRASTAPPPLVADARAGLEELDKALGGWKAAAAWSDAAAHRKAGVGDDRRRLHRARPTPNCPPTRRSSALCSAAPRRPTSSSARPAGCRASCTSCGRPARPAATTWNTATPAWATRSPAGSA